MDMKIDDIVKQVLNEVAFQKPEAPAVVLEKEPVFTGSETGRVAVLVSPETYEIKEYGIPEIGGKEILVKVEGCVVSPSDTAEFVKEKRVGQAALLGQEGTGVIVKLGSPSLRDAKGNLLHVGDRVVTVKKARGSVSTFRGNAANPGTAAGWYGNYVVLQAGNQLYQVNELDLESRLLTETVIAVNSAVERAVKLNRLDDTKRVIVLGCGLAGLITIAVLKCKGLYQVIGIDGDEKALKLAREFGAEEVIDYRMKNGVAGVQEKIRQSFGGSLADMIFHCTLSTAGKSSAKRFIKNGGAVCELGHVFGGGRASSKYYEESMPIGGRFYSSKDYEDCFAFLKNAAEKNIPLYKLVTHRYKLEQINEAHWAAIREEGLAIAVFNR